jgi:hypothetical protein
VSWPRFSCSRIEAFFAVFSCTSLFKYCIIEYRMMLFYAQFGGTGYEKS